METKVFRSQNHSNSTSETMPKTLLNLCSVLYIYIIIYITPKFLKVEPNLWHVITQFDVKYCKYGEQILKLVEMIIGKGDRKTTEN